MITHLSVKNYRSLKDLELDLGPLVVLIGPNGSGKSNILDVLRLVQEVAASGQNVGAAFSGRGGYDQVVWGGERGREIAIDVAWKTPARRDGSPGTYSVRLSENDHKSVGFENETLTTEAGDSLTMTGRSRFEFKDNSGGKSPGSMPAGYSVVSSFGADKWPDPALINSMFRWSFYRFDPLTMRTPQPVRREYGLVESGQNLSTVIHTLFSERATALGEIVDVLKACVNTVEDLLSPITDDGLTYVALKERSVPTAVGSWGLSDGTLLALGLATALMTPEPASLIVLEAPDIELHPHVMETVAEMLRIASEKTQVIATTHSPYLLDFLPPQSFVVVEKVKGATLCKPVKGRRGTSTALKKLGAGNAWVSGHLGGVP